MGAPPPSRIKAARQKRFSLLQSLLPSYPYVNNRSEGSERRRERDSKTKEGRQKNFFLMRKATVCTTTYPCMEAALLRANLILLSKNVWSPDKKSATSSLEQAHYRGFMIEEILRENPGLRDLLAAAAATASTQVAMHMTPAVVEAMKRLSEHGSVQRLLESNVVQSIAQCVVGQKRGRENDCGNDVTLSNNLQQIAKKLKASTKLTRLGHDDDSWIPKAMPSTAKATMIGILMLFTLFKLGANNCSPSGFAFKNDELSSLRGRWKNKKLADVLPELEDDETVNELLKHRQILASGVVIEKQLCDTLFSSDFTIVCRTKTADGFQTLMSCNPRGSSPRYALYLGRKNSLENCSKARLVKRTEIIRDSLTTKLEKWLSDTTLLNSARQFENVMENFKKSTVNLFRFTETCSELELPYAYELPESVETSADLQSSEEDTVFVVEDGNNDFFVLLKMKKVFDDDVCCICLEDMGDINSDGAKNQLCIAPCGHVFHTTCVNDHAKQSTKCPIGCQTELKITDQVSCQNKPGVGFDLEWINVLLKFQEIKDAFKDKFKDDHLATECVDFMRNKLKHFLKETELGKTYTLKQTYELIHICVVHVVVLHEIEKNNALLSIKKEITERIRILTKIDHNQRWYMNHFNSSGTQFTPRRLSDYERYVRDLIKT